MIKILATALVTCTITFSVTCYIYMHQNTISIGESIEFKSSEGDFYFEAIPVKGRDYKMMERNFLNYKKKNGLGDHVSIYRITRKNYLRISMWNNYKFSKEWNYPIR